MENQNTNTAFSVVIIITTITLLLQLGFTSIAFSQAVDLIPINTGNETLNSSLPLFYECIEEAVESSENEPQQAPYFEDEPTKNEVRVCYQEVFVDNPIEQVTDNPVEGDNVEAE